MTTRLATLVLTLSAGLTLAGLAPAQCSALQSPKTGCPGAPLPKCSGAPKIGTTVTVSRGPCKVSNAAPIIMLGAPPYFSLPLTKGITCNSGCSIGFLPFMNIIGSVLTLQIPNSTQLIGAEIGLHFTCFTPSLCLDEISPVWRIKLEK